MRGSWQQILAGVARRQDLLLVTLLILAIFMMILPLPTMLVDGLIATNIALTIIMLMVAVYLKDPLEFSTLPAVILLTTLFRLSLSITTTRLILVQADAGQIVETFGTFVVGGNVVVGLVVFLIITIVQFVVITKGAERIAEVSARFSLDAMPGKQMSIDSDLRSGITDLSEARRRRVHLEKESQLYGAMDGAMKFVKGDAIAGLVIIAVNLIGGIAIGTLQRDMPLNEAIAVYSLLTVGDGLIAQIPALFTSIAAGSIVTRVTREDSVDLGSDISSEIVNEPRTLRIAAVVLVFFAFIPGFPTAIFLLLAAMVGGAGLAFYWRDRRLAQREQEMTAHLLAPPEGLERRGKSGGLIPASPVTVRIGEGLITAMPAERFTTNVARLRVSLLRELGVPFPDVSLELARVLPEHAWRIVLDDVPIGEGELDPNLLWIRDDSANLELAAIPFELSRTHVPGEEAVVVASSREPELLRIGIGFLTPVDTLGWLLGRALNRYASEYVGIQETRMLLAGLETSHGDLVREAQRVVPLQKIAEVLRRLVSEGVPIRNLRLLLEALVEWGQKERDVALLAEYVRSALRRQISFRYATPQRLLPAYMLEQRAEEVIREAVRHTTVGSYLALDPELGEQLIARLKAELGELSSHRETPVVIASLDVRRFVRSLLLSHEVDLPVLSYQDLAPEVTVHPLGTIAV